MNVHNKKESDIVTANYYRYYKTFSLSGIVDFHEGPVDWIIPKKEKNGPSIAFNLRLDGKNAEDELKTLIIGIREKIVPKLWFVTPDSKPKNIIELLESHGFQNISRGGYEPGMLLYKNDFHPFIPTDSSVHCRRVRSKEDFAVWIDIVNTALHGWDMIDAEHYFTWCENEIYKLYLGEINGVPVSTAAVIQNGDTASLEFVSTLKEFRRRKAAATLCTKALEELFSDGVSTVTLSGAEEALSLYRALGFHDCFENIILQYDFKD